MFDGLKVEIVGAEGVRHVFAALDVDATARVARVVNLAALEIQSEARRRAPADHGYLAARIHIILDRSIGGVSAMVGCPLRYAPYVEFGARPHPAPWKNLEPWARRHGLPTYLVWKSILQYGTPARPFLLPAYVQVRPSFNRRLAEALDQAAMVARARSRKGLK